MQEKTGNPVVTAATVAVAQEAARSVRTKLSRSLPGDRAKWKYGKLDGFKAVVDCIAGHSLRFAVSQIYVSDESQWARFFLQGHEFVRVATTKGAGGSYLEPHLALKMHLLNLSSAALLGRIMRARSRGARGGAAIEIEFTADTDLRDTETEAFFQAALLEWPTRTRLYSELGIRPIVRDARCETEQAEPLLLLPDYLAGVYHHADPRTKLGSPVVSPEEASLAIKDLRQRTGALLYEETRDFSLEYPLDHDESGDVIQRGRGLE